MPISSKWDELSNKCPTFACEELLLRNTFINSQMGPIIQNEQVPKIDNVQSNGLIMMLKQLRVQHL